jgi:hypothetical protein
MEMDLHFTKPAPTEIADRIDVIRLILVNRKEERVFRRSAITVGEVSEKPWVSLRPILNTLRGDRVTWRAPLWLEMIGDAQEHIGTRAAASL